MQIRLNNIWGISITRYVYCLSIPCRKAFYSRIHPLQQILSVVLSEGRQMKRMTFFCPWQPVDHKTILTLRLKSIFHCTCSKEVRAIWPNWKDTKHSLRSNLVTYVTGQYCTACDYSYLAPGESNKRIFSWPILFHA